MSDLFRHHREHSVVCLGKMCDWRDQCRWHIHALPCAGVLHVSYHQPQQTGEFCRHFARHQRDSDSREVQR